MSETETAPEPAAEAESSDTPTTADASVLEADVNAEADASAADREAAEAVPAAQDGDGETEEERAARIAARKKRILKRSLIQTAFVLLLPALAFLGLAFYKARKVDLIVDNGFGFAVKLIVNGKELTTVPRLDHKIVKNLSGGTVTLVAIEQGPNGESGKQFTIQGEVKTELFADRRQTYVWNIGGQTAHYSVVAKDYDSADRRVRETEQKTFEQDLFALPDEFLPQLNAGFPKASQVERGGKRQMLWTAYYVGKIEANRAAQALLGTGKLRSKMRPNQKKKRKRRRKRKRPR